jgi:hypothetical protein
MRKKFLRWILLSALIISVSLLFMRYTLLQREKASLIMLASYYPFDDNFDDDLSEKIFRTRANTNNPDGFFQYQEVYGKLADAVRELTTAERRLRSYIPVNLDSGMRIEKSVPLAIRFHEDKVNISPKDRRYFQHSMARYIHAFRDVLKHDRWKASIDRLEVQHEDSIKIDVVVVASELELFNSEFRMRDQIVIDTIHVDLVNPTVYELFVGLEHIKWHRYDVEAGYDRILRYSHKQWIDTLQLKSKH